MQRSRILDFRDDCGRNPGDRCGVYTFLRHTVTPQNADRIRPGMMRAEVEAILGPPGNYYRWNQPLLDPRIILEFNWNAGEADLWTADDFAIGVQ